MYSIKTNNGELYHYGVLGMKWGVRNDNKSSNGARRESLYKNYKARRSLKGRLNPNRETYFKNREEATKNRLEKNYNARRFFKGSLKNSKKEGLSAKIKNAKEERKRKLQEYYSKRSYSQIGKEAVGSFLLGGGLYTVGKVLMNNSTTFGEEMVASMLQGFGMGSMAVSAMTTGELAIKKYAESSKK